MLYTDTDSFILSFDTTNFEEDILDKGISHNFDFSNMNEHLKELPVYKDLLEQEKEDVRLGLKEKKGIGLMKEELGWLPNKECVCMSAKSYSLIPDIEKMNELVELPEEEMRRIAEQKNTGKGTPRYILKSNLPHEMYRNIVLQEELVEHRGSSYNMRAQPNHDILTLKQEKVWLSNWNDKRYSPEYAYGHFQIEKDKDEVKEFIEDVIEEVIGDVFDIVERKHAMNEIEDDEISAQ